MKPELGNAATSAPSAASGQLAPRCRASHVVAAMISTADTSHTVATIGSNNWSNGVVLPKRHSMHGSAKYSTNMFSPGTASMGSTRDRAAR